LKSEDWVAKRLINLGDRQVEGQTVRFEPKSEPWCEYKCADGTTIRLKVVVSEIVRLDDVFNEDREPVYVVRSANTVSCDVPEGLKHQGPPKGTEIQ